MWIYDYFPDWFWNYGFPLIFTFFFIFFYPVVRYSIKKIILLRFNFRIIIFCLLVVIANIFGFNSAVFNSYSVSESNNNSLYNWFNVTDVLKFPMEQYSLSNNVYPTIDFDSKSELDTLPHNYIILIDKTGSNKTKTDQLIQNELIKIISEEKGIGATDLKSCDLTESELKKLSISDLVLIQLIRNLYFYKGLDKGRELNLLVRYYKGEGLIAKDKEDLKSVIDYNKEGDNEGERCDRLESVITNRELNSKATTSYSKMFKWLFNTENYFKKHKKNHLIILSDFKNEEVGDTLTETLTQFCDPNDLNLNKISLIKSYSKASSTKSSFNTVATLEQFFSKDKLYKYNEEDLLNVQNKMDDYLSCILTTPVENKDKMDFYKTHFDRSNSYQAGFNVRKKLEINEGESIIISFNDPSYSNSKSDRPYLKLGKVKISLGERLLIPYESFEEKQIIELVSTVELSKNAFIEIAATNKIQSFRCKLNFHTIIPNDMALTLVICYLIVIYLLVVSFLIVFLLAFKSYYYFKRGDFDYFSNLKMTKIQNRLFYIVMFVVSFLLLCYSSILLFGFIVSIFKVCAFNLLATCTALFLYTIIYFESKLVFGAEKFKWFQKLNMAKHFKFQRIMFDIPSKEDNENHEIYKGIIEKNQNNETQKSNKNGKKGSIGIIK